MCFAWSHAYIITKCGGGGAENTEAGILGISGILGVLGDGRHFIYYIYNVTGINTVTKGARCGEKHSRRFSVHVIRCLP